ncbi:MAG: urease accessory protein UreE [Aestuariivirga sp.]
MTLRATSFVRASYLLETPWEIVVMDSTARHLRRKLITLQHGDEVLVDLKKTVKFEDRDCLILEDGRLVQIKASDEELLEVTARDAAHLTQLAWHIGNRHLEAQIEKTRILIRRDHVISKMLEQFGATVKEVREPFTPEHGAYAHGH